MKAASFAYERPESLDAAVALLGTGDGFAKVLAGGQSLGPMLNLRLVQPDLLVDLQRIPGLREAREDGDWLVLGAGVTHAAIEDGQVPDVTGGAMAGIAAGIAYRAVRNRGSIGGSLAHADPAADWPCCLTALGAEIVASGPDGHRTIPSADFMLGAFETALAPDEILEAVRIPRLAPSARWGYYKACRKIGEFAHAMSAVLADAETGVSRVVVGATESRPIVIEDAAGVLGVDVLGGPGEGLDRDAASRLLAERGLVADAIAMQIHLTALERALERARRWTPGR